MSKTFLNGTKIERCSDFLHVFFTFVFDTLCACPKTECVVPDLLYKFPKFKNVYFSGEEDTKTFSCNTITTDLDVELSVLLDYLQSFHLLTIRQNKFYILDGYKRLSWKNIATLDGGDARLFFEKHPDIFHECQEFFTSSAVLDFDLFIIAIKCLYWYIRKVCVDCIASPILKKNKVRGMSVGSTNISSDYDITLYGKSFTKISETIEKFNKRFQDIFKETSDFIFDTNIYGVSFINVSESHANVSGTNSPGVASDDDTNFYEYNDKLSDDEKECNNKRFRYIKTNNETNVSQHVWAFVKLLVKLESVSNHDAIIANLLTQEMSKEKNSLLTAIWQESKKFVNMYQPNPKYYYKFIKVLKDVEPSEVDLPLFNNFISFANYNGIETYFTRGTFLHVVVNMQMCKDAQELQLSDDEYLDSFVENMSDLLHHYNKEKYLIRSRNALLHLKDGLSSNVFTNVEKRLKSIHKLQSDCTTMNNILKCSSFLLMNMCMLCIIDVTNDFLHHRYTTDEIQDGLSVFNLFLKSIPDKT